MTSPSFSIYDCEQHLFELAQNFMRSRIIFASIELNIFDLLLSYNDGLSCSEIAKQLDLHYIENESRCLQDVLDSLTSMNFLERNDEKITYKLTEFTHDYLLPNRKVLSNIDQEFYQNMPRFDTILLDSSSNDSINHIMLLRIKQLVDLTNYSKISIDSIDKNADVIIIWRQDGLLKQKLEQVYDALPSNGNGLFILIIPNDEHDEVTIALNLLMNMTTTIKQQEIPKSLYSIKYLKQLGFQCFETKKSADSLELILAYK